MTDNLSASDVLALTNSRNGMFGDGDWMWVLLAFALLGGGFGGFGGFGGNSGALTEAQLCSGFNFNNLENGVRAIQNGICDSTFALNNSILNGFHGVDNAICNLGYTMQQGFNGVERGISTLGYQTQAGMNALSSQLSDCCCGIQRGIDGINYNLATQSCDTRNTIQNTTRDIIDNQNSNTRAILDFLTNDKIASLQAENTTLKFQASQAKQNDFISAVGNSIVSRLETPCPVPAYSVYPPTPVYAFNNGCGCGCGCN